MSTVIIYGSLRFALQCPSATRQDESHAFPLLHLGPKLPTLAGRRCFHLTINSDSRGSPCVEWPLSFTRAFLLTTAADKGARAHSRIPHLTDTRFQA